ncbi:glutamate--cysteine ligase [Cryobacterium sp. HLT2-28]|uniref:glutamate--cysteine ligase n=1 Tax=Cryobacterium sp. HLT2-28 TaxID=1259146 RepID=UPI00106C1087|nr:glutamate--cysteine ligase [Cryobacterium sp. HLT2-28]TFB97614.1 YbdK family carboxylate-amine ligase [Cryobacterium sp. HLT2-28]
MRTFGVEEELLIVDPADGRPLPLASELLASSRTAAGVLSAVGGAVLALEFKQEQIEVQTSPCSSLDGLFEEILRGRDTADAAARAVGARVAALATSPVATAPHTTPVPRYAAIMDSFGVTARDQLTCGLHVHVSVDSDEEGVAVLDRIRIWFPALAALSANSPYWNGDDTGYASYRTQAWGRWPTAGPVKLFGSAAGYHALIAGYIASGVLLDEGMVYFDARLSRKYPTVEVRVSDVCWYAEDAVLIAGLVRALVETAVREWRRGIPPRPVPAALLRLALWRASRSGMNGDLLHPVDNRPQPAPEVIEALLSYVSAALADSGDLACVRSGLAAITRRGTGEGRQRAMLARTGELSAVVTDAIRSSCCSQSPGRSAAGGGILSTE